MINIINLNRQHDTIKTEIALIEAELKKGKEALNPSEAALHISRLAGQLRIHLLEEDKFMYPSLLNASDEEIRKLADLYIQEMGHLAEEYINFKNNFNVASKISSNLDTFMTEANRIITALKERMLKEDKELYHMITVKKL